MKNESSKIITKQLKSRFYYLALENRVARFPKKRTLADKIIKITYSFILGKYEIRFLEHTRRTQQVEEFKAWDNSIIISETPFKLRTVDTSTCLAIILADPKRLIASAIHIPFPMFMITALECSTWAMNSTRKNLVIGLSGMNFVYSDGSEDEVRNEVVTVASKYGKVIYNELGKKGDIAVNLKNKIIYSPSTNEFVLFPY